MIEDLHIAERLDRAKAERDQLDRLIAWLQAGAEFDTAPPPPAAKVKPPPKPSKAAARDIEGKVLSAILNANRPVSRDDIAATTGMPKEKFEKQLRKLVVGKRVIAEGGPRNRRYHSAPREFHSTHRARTEAGKEPPAQEAARVSRVGLRDRVMKALSAQPMTEVDLAAALGLDRDAVAEATGWLLERDRLHLDPDGTYRRNGAKAVA